MCHGSDVSVVKFHLKRSQQTVLVKKYFLKCFVGDEGEKLETFVNGVIDDWAEENNKENDKIASGRTKSLSSSQGKTSSSAKYFFYKKYVKKFVCGNDGRIWPLCEITSVIEILLTVINDAHDWTNRGGGGRWD